MRFTVLFAICWLAFTPIQALSADRIISLAPHTTEWLYALELGEHLVAVSAYSDYPAEASLLPVVADANGIDLEQIIRLDPDLILAWQGGNKPQDLARLKNLGLPMFLSSPQSPDDIATELLTLGKQLDIESRAQQLVSQLREQLSAIRSLYAQTQTRRVFYYMWLTPLMSIGPDAWATRLLDYCNAEHIFMDADVDYPQVSAEQVIRRQPSMLIAASQLPLQQHQHFWQRWQTVLSVPIRVVDPDLLHRFTPRIVQGLEQLCAGIHQTSNSTADN